MKETYTFKIEYNKDNGNWSATCVEDKTILAGGHKKKRRGKLNFSTDVYPTLCETIVLVKNIEIVKHKSSTKKLI